MYELLLPFIIAPVPFPLTTYQYIIQLLHKIIKFMRYRLRKLKLREFQKCVFYQIRKFGTREINRLYDTWKEEVHELQK